MWNVRRRLRRLRPVTFLLSRLERGLPPAPLKDYLGDPAFVDDLFEVSAPERVGMDEAKLLAAVREAERRRLPLHAFLVLRKGKLVLERYGTNEGQQLTPRDAHELHSTTKTVTGTLVGLAIADGRIPSVSAAVLPYFTGSSLGEHVNGKEKLTIEDLLTMRSGLGYFEGGDDALFHGTGSSAERILSRPLVAEPGTRFCYSSADSQILAEVVRRATGRSPLELATARIFAPLGIAKVDWRADASSTEYGGWGLSLRPRDLARFGLVYLSGGLFFGKRIVPEAWIREAIQPRVKTDSTSAYGYHLWVSRFGGFATHGYQGQNMYLFPELELLVVFNGALPSDSSDYELDRLVKGFILKAVKA